MVGDIFLEELQTTERNSIICIRSLYLVVFLSLFPWRSSWGWARGVSYKHWICVYVCYIPALHTSTCRCRDVRQQLSLTWLYLHRGHQWYHLHRSRIQDACLGWVVAKNPSEEILAFVCRLLYLTIDLASEQCFVYVAAKCSSSFHSTVCFCVWVADFV